MDHSEPPDPSSQSWSWSTAESWTSDPDQYQDYYDSSYAELCDRSVVQQLRAQVEPLLFWSTAALGLMGNLLVLWVYLRGGRGLCCGGRGLKALTHLFLLHLCAADLLFLLTLPLWARESTAGWRLGETLCKINSYLYKVNLFSVSLFLACIAVDRYVVIVHATAALNSQSRRRNWACAVSVSVWLLALLLATPELAFATVTGQGDHMTCRLKYPPAWGPVAKATTFGLQVSVGFFVPLVVMAVCYAVIGRRLLTTRTFHKHRPLLVVVAIVVVFVVTQLPYTCVLIAEMLDSSLNLITSCRSRLDLDRAGLVLRGVAYCHPALNPFLYALIGRRFRQEVMSLLPRFGSQKKTDFLSKIPPRVRTWTGSGNGSGNGSGSGPKTRTLSDSETSQGLSL